MGSSFKALDVGIGFDSSFIEVDVFGLTYDYIEENNLVWVENLHTGSSKKSGVGLEDAHHPDHSKPYAKEYIEKFGVRKVEANALLKNIPAARGLLDENITKYVGFKAMKEYNNSLIRTRLDLKKAFENIWKTA